MQMYSYLWSSGLYFAFFFKALVLQTFNIPLYSRSNVLMLKLIRKFIEAGTDKVFCAIEDLAEYLLG